MLDLKEYNNAITFKVRLLPRASRNAVRGEHGGALKIALTAPPVEGAANQALVDFLAKILGVKKGAVKIMAGEKSRHKTVRVEGVPAAAVKALLKYFPPGAD